MFKYAIIFSFTLTDDEACPSEPPSVRHGTATINGTHVNYRCDEGYAFPDKTVEKSFICGCEMLTNISVCIGRKYLYILIYYRYTNIRNAEAAFLSHQYSPHPLIQHLKLWSSGCIKGSGPYLFNLFLFVYISDYQLHTS